jgi:hypothetical protein
MWPLAGSMEIHPSSPLVFHHKAGHVVETPITIPADTTDAFEVGKGLSCNSGRVQTT